MADGMAFIGGFNSAYRMMQDREERKRREEADKQLGQLYFDMASKDAYQNVQPYEDYSTNSRLKANVADSNLAAVNAPITTSPDRLADTRSLRFMSMTPEERAQAGITSEQSAQMDNALKAEGPVNVQQANAGVAQTLSPIAQQASVNSQNAEQMLAMAKEKYGTDMFDKMQPYIGKIPSDKLIGIVNNMQAKAQQQADKLALNSAMAVFGRKDASDDEKKQAAVTIATLKPELGKMFQNFFAPKDDSFTLSPGQVRYVNGKPIANVPKDNSLTPYQAERLRLQALGLQDKEPKKAEWEKEHLAYEKGIGMTDAQVMQEYWAISSDPAQASVITPEKQAKFNVASARINKYLGQQNLTADEQNFLNGIDRSKVSKEEGFKMLQQYRMNKLNGIRQ